MIRSILLPSHDVYTYQRNRETDIAPSKGAFNFSQATLPLLLSTLLFTGATASVKGSALFASFATMKFALRAMAQSLAREFGPQGVHVAHAVIDGVIDIPRTKEWDLGEGGKIDPEAVS